MLGGREAASFRRDIRLGSASCPRDSCRAARGAGGSHPRRRDAERPRARPPPHRIDFGGADPHRDRQTVFRTLFRIGQRHRSPAAERDRRLRRVSKKCLEQSSWLTRTASCRRRTAWSLCAGLPMMRNSPGKMLRQRYGAGLFRGRRCHHRAGARPSSRAARERVVDAIQAPLDSHQILYQRNNTEDTEYDDY